MAQKQNKKRQTNMGRGRTKNKNRPRDTKKETKNKGKDEFLNQVLENENLQNLLRTDPQLQGPREEERQFRRWTKEQIDRFLVCGEWSDSDAEEEDVEQKGGEEETKREEVAERDVEGTREECSVDTYDDMEITTPFRPMPMPRPLDTVFGASGGADSPAAGHTGMLGALLDPDAGGKNKNKNGIMGLVASRPDAVQKPEDKRARLKARLAYMQRNRNAKEVQRDARGNRIRGGLQITPEDLEYGTNNTAAMRNGTVDKQKSAAMRRKLIEKQVAEKKAEIAARQGNAEEAV